jgi:hypothetical protein
MDIDNNRLGQWQRQGGGFVVHERTGKWKCDDRDRLEVPAACT